VLHGESQANFGVNLVAGEKEMGAGKRKGPVKIRGYSAGMREKGRVVEEEDGTQRKLISLGI